MSVGCDEFDSYVRALILEEEQRHKEERLRDQFFCAALTGYMGNATFLANAGFKKAIGQSWEVADEALKQRNGDKG